MNARGNGQVSLPLSAWTNFCATIESEHLHLLHSDIQGFELEMLQRRGERI